MGDFIKKNKINFILLLAIFVIFIGLLVFLRLEGIDKEDESLIINKCNDEAEEQEQKATVKVDIQGSVVTPGVYEFEDGDIIDDALRKAGGLLETADYGYVDKNINRAETLKDQQKIYIPAKEETSVDNVDTKNSYTSGKININTASLSELDNLPGIGPSYAQKIIDGRPYEKIEDIKNIKGIGDATFEKIKEDITI